MWPVRLFLRAALANLWDQHLLQLKFIHRCFYHGLGLASMWDQSLEVFIGLSLIHTANLQRWITGTTITALRDIFSRHGPPEIVVSDNGPHFTAKEFAKFCANNGISHRSSAACKPSTKADWTCSPKYGVVLAFQSHLLSLLYMTIDRIKQISLLFS